MPIPPVPRGNTPQLLVALLKCFRQDAEVDFDWLRYYLNTSRVEAQKRWLWLKTEYGLGSGDFTRYPSTPSPEEIRDIIYAIWCFNDRPELDYTAMSWLTRLPEEQVRGKVANLYAIYFTPR